LKIPQGRVLINVQFRKFVDNLQKILDFKIVLEHLTVLDMTGTDGLHLISTSYLILGGRGILNWLAETAKESAKVFSSLGIKEMLKAEKKLLIRSHTSFL